MIILASTDLIWYIVPMGYVYTILDTEVVSVFKPALLEFGAIKIDEDFKIIEEIEVRTGVEWPQNHVSGEKVAIGKYSIDEAKLIARNFIEGTVVGHNLAFDARVLGLAFHKYLDIMIYARDVMKTPRYRLKDIAMFMGVNEVQPHRALGDCLTTLHILSGLKSRKLSHP